jgi:hypothetical protein
MTGNFDQFCYTVAALDHESLLLIVGIVRSPPVDLTRGKTKPEFSHFSETHG